MYKSQAIFGGFDGLSSAVGVVVAAIVSRHLPGLLPTALGLAVAAAISMAGGEYLSDDSRNIKRASVMGVSTLVGSLLPALPFFFLSLLPAAILAVIICAASTALIGVERGSTPKSFIEAYSILSLAIILTVVVTLLVGVGA